MIRQAQWDGRPLQSKLRVRCWEPRQTYSTPDSCWLQLYVMNTAVVIVMIIIAYTATIKDPYCPESCFRTCVLQFSRNSNNNLYSEASLTTYSELSTSSHSLCKGIEFAPSHWLIFLLLNYVCLSKLNPPMKTVRCGWKPKGSEPPVKIPLSNVFKHISRYGPNSLESGPGFVWEGFDRGALQILYYTW